MAEIPAKVEAEKPAMVEAEKPAMVVGIDDSELSHNALEWTLDHFFTTPDSHFKLFLVHAKPVASSVIGLAGPGGPSLIGGSSEVLDHMDFDLKSTAARVLDKAKEICSSKSVSDVVLEVVEGDARSVLCEAVERHNATLLVTGSHGYGTIKRAFLGSVSDYCAHHAHCTVMIVKKPKTKN